MNVYIGVDPGKKGGYSVLYENGKAESYPWDDSGFVKKMSDISSEFHKNQIFVLVEKVGAMPGQGVVSMFHFGKSAGFIEGVLNACYLTYELVPPQRWKKYYGLSSDKLASIEKCQELFPGTNLLATARSHKPSDGMAESLLIANYGKEMQGVKSID